LLQNHEDALRALRAQPTGTWDIAPSDGFMSIAAAGTHHPPRGL